MPLLQQRHSTQQFGVSPRGIISQLPISKMVLARWCSSTLQPHNRLTRHPILKEMIYTLRFAVLHISSRKSPTHVITSALQLRYILQKYKKLHITVHILITLCASLIVCPVMQNFKDTLYIPDTNKRCYTL